MALGTRFMRPVWCTAALVASSVLLVVSAAQAKSGDLDPSFGTGGIATTAYSTYANFADIALQPDEKIVAVGGADLCSSGCGDKGVLARYTPDGVLDHSF